MSNNKKSNDHIPDVRKKVSSLEWLYNKMYEHRGNITIEEYEQAKEMHKEEHRNTYNQGLMSKFQNFDDYYNETFNNADTDSN